MGIKILLLGTKDECIKMKINLNDDSINVIGMVDDENKVLDEISKTSPDIIFVLNSSAMAIRCCHQIYLLRPRTTPVLLGEASGTEDLEKVLQAGIHYFIAPKSTNLEIVSEMKSIFNNETSRMKTLENTSVTSNKSKVLVVFGCKDGVGKTTLAVNLAVKLSQKGNKVVVVDYNLKFGDIGAYLGTDSKNTIADLFQEQRNPNIDLIRQFLTLHSSGVSFLAAPHNPDQGDVITVGYLEHLIGALRVYYDYVIVDSVSGVNNVNVACFDCASMILVLTRKDIPSLRNVKKVLPILDALSNSDKVKLITSMDDGMLKNQDIAQAVGRKIWATIPFEPKTAAIAANRGEPFVGITGAKGSMSRAISDMAVQIDGAGGEEEVLEKKEVKKSILKRREK